jgi:hypothetical protein
MNWTTLAENFWFATVQPVDPGWQQVYDRMAQANSQPDPYTGPFTGRFGADFLSDQEAAYVYGFTHTQPGMALANKVYWESGIFSGPRVAISRLINRGELHWNAMNLNAWDTVTQWPDSPLKQAVLATSPEIPL